MVEGNYGENPDPNLEHLERRDAERVFWKREKISDEDMKKYENKKDFYRNQLGKNLSNFKEDARRLEISKTSMSDEKSIGAKRRILGDYDIRKITAPEDQLVSLENASDILVANAFRICYSLDE